MKGNICASCGSESTDLAAELVPISLRLYEFGQIYHRVVHTFETCNMRYVLNDFCDFWM